MRTIKIKHNPLGDTRTATRVPTILEFSKSNRDHRDDVDTMMRALADDICKRGIDHDITKIRDPAASLFYRELCAKIEGSMDDFTRGEWYPMHCKTERHHLLDCCPDDVNLIDVIEMVCDCVCAGMARTGDVYPVDIPPEILQKAVANTVDLLRQSVEVQMEKE